MERKHYSLETSEDNRFIKIIRFVFGVLCIGVALWWGVYNIRSPKTDQRMWITIAFLTGFGLYQVWSALGKTKKFVSIDPESVSYKGSSLAPVTMINIGELIRMEFHPFTVVFYFKSGDKRILRFGSVNYETNEKIVDELIGIAEARNIKYEIKEDDIHSP